ncbi:hypothetical protein [Brevibacillus fulvus]|uniref:UTP:GlnB (Protein PII) uridylyltransferase n=1 Tax=Brevibacillus fulvus TaxID=1125967 RepID=A0A938XUW5_9BACL|nr:hypothetical protein [Brevibacillus fulvus]MBM7590918.1 UTP:GlnB (protein PII) uridylyltransferase [Brevibacillus fulvus]
MKSSTLSNITRARSLITETTNLTALLNEEKQALHDTEQQLEQLAKKQIDVQNKVNHLDMSIGDNILELVTILAKLVRDRLENVYSSNPERFVEEDGTIDLQQDDLFAQETEELLDLFEYHDQVYSREYIRDYVREKLDHSVFTEAEETVREMYQDSVAYRKNPLGYHGLSQRDFLAG